MIWRDGIDNHVLVDAETTERIFSKAQTNDGETVEYGYGWLWRKYKDDLDLVGHAGDWVGFNSFIGKEPESKIWFVAFSNTTAIDSVSAVSCMAEYYLNLDSLK